jgi:hypothetical protein
MGDLGESSSNNNHDGDMHADYKRSVGERLA